MPSYVGLRGALVSIDAIFSPLPQCCRPRAGRTSALDSTHNEGAAISADLSAGRMFVLPCDPCLIDHCLERRENLVRSDLFVRKHSGRIHGVNNHACATLKQQ